LATENNLSLKKGALIKYISLLTLTFLLSSALCVAMNQQDEDLTLTEIENKCWQWFQSLQTKIPCHNKLDPKDQKFFGGDLLYKDHKEGIDRSRKNYVEALYKGVEEYNEKGEDKITIEYDEKITFNTILKLAKDMHSGIAKIPTDELGARKEAYKMLTPEQKEMYSKKGYDKAPKATEDAVRVWSQNFDKLVIQHNILKGSTEQEIHEMANQLFADQMARFKYQYTEQKP